MTDLKDMVKALTDKVEELHKRSNMPEQQRNTPRTGNASGIICYACNNRGHIAVPREVTSAKHEQQRK